MGSFGIIELLREAKAHGAPVIIVEGKTDIKIYENFSSELKKETTIIPVELIEGGNGKNCIAIIKIVRENQDLQKELKKDENTKWLVGIIDGDARKYKPESEQIGNDVLGLYALDLYSFESYFISRENLKHLLSTVSNMPEKKITDRTIDYFLKEFEPIEERLFYLSIDCLIALYEGQGISTFEDYQWNHILYDKRVNNELEIKMEKIKEFMQTHQVTISNDAKRIIKGRWLTYAFYETVRNLLNKFPDNCKDTSIQIDRCNYCSFSDEQRKSCLWKPTKYSTYDQFKPIVYQNTDNPEFNEIKNLIKKLGN